MYDDCFAKQHICTALNKMFCKDGECPFYKPKEQFDEDLKQYPELDNKEVAARHWRSERYGGIKRCQKNE